MKKNPIKIEDVGMDWKKCFFHLQGYLEGFFMLIFQDGYPYGLRIFYPAFVEESNKIPSPNNDLLTPMETKIYNMVEKYNESGNRFYGSLYVVKEAGKIKRITTDSHQNIHFRKRTRA